MEQFKVRTFSAHEPILPSINGYQFKVNGQEFIFHQCFILSASVVIHYPDPTQSAQIQIPNGVQPSLSIDSHARKELILTKQKER